MKKRIISVVLLLCMTVSAFAGCKAEYEKETAIVNAEKELEVAKLEAQAKLEKAKADAEAQIEVARAEAQAVKLKSIEVARSLGFTIKELRTENTVEYEIDFTGKSADEVKLITDYLKYIEYLGKWDGKLPETYFSSDDFYSLLAALGTQKLPTEDAGNTSTPSVDTTVTP